MPGAESIVERAQVAAPIVPAVPLADGELITLALKPSPWFIVRLSLPVLAAAAAVCGAAFVVSVADPAATAGPAKDILYSASGAVVLARLGVACWQWLGRSYLLTNRRVMCVVGVLSVQITAAALAAVVRVELVRPAAERLGGAGSICCLGPDQACAVVWTTVAKPVEIAEIVAKAVARAKGK